MMRHHGDGHYQREVDYEDYDEYEDEFEEEEEEEAAPKLTKEEQDFLKLRQQLKERAKKNLKKEISHDLGRSSQSQDKNRSIRKDTFGSFFGPSQPVIASRVLEESRSIRETKHILENVYSNKKESTSSGTKTDGHRQSSSHHQSSAHHQPRKVVNEVKKKAQTLKDMRDYSFLLSDDADLPIPSKEQPVQRKVSAPVPDRQSTQPSLKNKASASKPPAKVASSSQELRNPSSSVRALPNKARILKDAPISRTGPSSIRKVSGSSVGHGLTKPARVASSSQEVRKVPGSSVGHGLTKKAVPNAASNKAPVQVMHGNRPTNNANIASSKKIVSSIKPKSSVQQQYTQQRRPNQAPAQSRPTLKQPLPSKSQPSKQNSLRANPDDRLKKRPLDRNSSDDDHDSRPRKRPPPRNFDDEDEVDYRSLIRGMFGYNPNKYAGMDEDDSDMEVGFDKIQMEEKRSAKIAKKEDEEELRLIELEEERERQRKMMKKKLK